MTRILLTQVNKPAKNRLGLSATPHFFFLRRDGSKVAEIQGVVPRDSLVAMLVQLTREGAR